MAVAVPASLAFIFIYLLSPSSLDLIRVPVAGLVFSSPAPTAIKVSLSVMLHGVYRTASYKLPKLFFDMGNSKRLWFSSCFLFFSLSPLLLLGERTSCFTQLQLSHLALFRYLKDSLHTNSIFSLSLSLSPSVCTNTAPCIAIIPEP